MKGFQGFKLSFNKRAEIRELIGAKAERLVWIFCVVDRLSIDKLVQREYDDLFNNKDNKECDMNKPYECHSRIEFGQFVISFIGVEEFYDFLELTLADW